MTLKPTIWFPISALLCIANVASVGFAAAAAEPLHATAHAALAVAFGWWAAHLRHRIAARTEAAQVESAESLDAIDGFGRELDMLHQALSETQERLDFAERLLAQTPEARRVDPSR